MDDIGSHFSLHDRTPFTQLFISILIILFVGISVFIFMSLGGALVFGVDLGKMSADLLTGTDVKSIGFLRYLMISQGISFFIIPAFIVLNLMKPSHQKSLMSFKKPEIHEFALVVLLSFCLLPITSITGQLNAGIHLPEWLSGVEHWMLEKEENANSLIENLIVSDSVWIMIINLIMIAILPAIGEELIFRGVIQKILYGFFKSGQPAIWITAFLFSALHFQFFGFLPRFILGLVFGYLFLWSGTLWLPMIAHFVNNGVAVIGTYIGGTDYMNPQGDVNLLKELLKLPLPLIAGVLILWYFGNKSKTKSESELNKSDVTDV